MPTRRQRETAEIHRAMDEHDPAAEPYASMTRDELRQALEHEELTPMERERLYLHLIDRLNPDEKLRHDLVTDWLVVLHHRKLITGNAQGAHAHKVITDAVFRLLDDMPPIGPPEIVN